MNSLARVVNGLENCTRIAHSNITGKQEILTRHVIKQTYVVNSIFKKSFCTSLSKQGAGNILADANKLVSTASAVSDFTGDRTVVQSEVQSTKKTRSAGLKVLEKYDLGKFEVTAFPPTFNFAAYVDDSPTLQELVKLGVNLYKWEKKKGIPKFVLQLDFFRDMSPHIKFLHDVGVLADNLGMFLTKNPLIFKEDLDDLNVRINYLESKKFSCEMVAEIVTKNPYWLMFSTKRIDRRLGHFQKTFNLTGGEVRYLAVKQPKLITYNMHHIKTNTFVLKEELGLSNTELKILLMRNPRLWIISQLHLKKRFEFIHMEMQIPHEIILKHPDVLSSREFRTKERHLFLKSLKRDQYDPKLENYVSLKTLVTGTNAEFAVNVAKTSVDTFNMFLKTL